MSFSLKDQLFNEAKVSAMAKRIEAVYPKFKTRKYIQEAVEQFPQLELKERMHLLRDLFKQYLPADYREATTILLNSLPEPCDPSLSDDDFGDFIYSPHGEFVATYGCNQTDLQFSFRALKEMTTRFSAEGPIRPFLNQFPHETLDTLLKWSKDAHYHVRRLASEGTRPKLPWAPKIIIEVEDAIPLLDQLYYDKTRFVTRSVANHLNDIAKIKPELVLTCLKRWKDSKKQTPKEMDYIIRHSLRTLVKKGHPATLNFLGFSTHPAITVTSFQVLTPVVQLGEALAFNFEIEALKDEDLIIDYRIHFLTKKGKLKPKVFKIKVLSLKKGKSTIINKKHPLKKMTTKALYPGRHQVELQINGQSFQTRNFDLKT